MSALHLNWMRARLPGPHPVRLVRDPADQPGPQRFGGDQQPLVGVLPAVPREVVEQVGDVLADGRVGGQQAEVLIQPGGGRVVVAGADVAVAQQRPVGFLTDDEQHLAVGLQADEAVDDVAARLLQLPGPGDVGPLVAARFDLDDHDHLLAELGRVDQRVHDRRVAAGPVQRLLDGQHAGVSRRRLDEPLDAGGERLVRVMHQDVTLAQRGEDVGVLRDDGGGGHERRVPELADVEVGDRGQAGQVQRPGHTVHRAPVHAQLGDEPVQHVAGHRVLDLEPDRRIEAPPEQFALQRLQQVFGEVLVHFQVPDPGDPEGVMLDDVPGPRTAASGAPR